jgi:hypothetical protein
MNLARYLQKSIRIEKKILKYTSHQNFISRCIQESVVPKGFQIKWNICLDTTDSDKDRYKDILFRSSFVFNPAQISLKHSSQLTNKTTLATSFVFIRHIFHCDLHVCLCFHIVGKTG